MAAAKKVAKKKKPPAGRSPRKPAKKPVRGDTRGKKSAKTPVRRRKLAARFGRVKVAVDARLDLVFQKDYQAREIFDFLKVQTIRELEQFAPDEIIERITSPMVQTVLRIRKMVALANRHLAKDEKFAKSFLAEVQQPR